MGDVWSVIGRTVGKMNGVSPRGDATKYNRGGGICAAAPGDCWSRIA